MTLSFSKMWGDPLQSYDVDKIKSTLGGGINSPAIANACCVRVSHALLKAGHSISIASDYKDKNGNKYIIKVKTIKSYLTSQFGEPLEVDGYDVSDKQGIMLFEKSFSDATGHVCLFKNGSFPRGDDDDFRDDCTACFIWEFE